MKKVRIGVLGGHRGGSMINYAKMAENAELVAICDKNPDVLARQKKECGEDGISYYSNFEDFIKHDMDAVVLANYAHQHAPFAIRCMEEGKHVFSEVVPAQTMKEAVELIETVERTGKIYAYGENYCFMSGLYEMRKLYRQGLIGELEQASAEYMHNCEPIWHEITYGEPDHWRNRMYSTFYCTHSLGPIVHITGLRPVKVTGFESKLNERRYRVGSKCASYGIEMVEFENGGLCRSIHGNIYKNNLWYSIDGSKGRIETAREDSHQNGVYRVYVSYDEYSGAYDTEKREDYCPENFVSEEAKKFGHGGSDFNIMYNFVRKIQGFEDADIIDVYEAMDMFLPGMFAYRSILQGGVTLDIPDLRDPAVREQYRNDTTCTDPDIAGDMLIPSCGHGDPEIPMEVYDRVRQKWDNFKTSKECSFQ